MARRYYNVMNAIRKMSKEELEDADDIFDFYTEDRISSKKTRKHKDEEDFDSE